MDKAERDELDSRAQVWDQLTEFEDQIKTLLKRLPESTIVLQSPAPPGFPAPNLTRFPPSLHLKSWEALKVVLEIELQKIQRSKAEL